MKMINNYQRNLVATNEKLKKKLEFCFLSFWRENGTAKSVCEIKLMKMAIKLMINKLYLQTIK